MIKIDKPKRKFLSKNKGKYQESWSWYEIDANGNFPCPVIYGLIFSVLFMQQLAVTTTFTSLEGMMELTEKTTSSNSILRTALGPLFNLLETLHLLEIDMFQVTLPYFLIDKFSVVHNRHIYIFGGYDGINRVNDFYGYDIDFNTWRKVVANSAPNN